MRFIVALLIASLFVDKADSELSFIRRHNLYPCASYSPGVRSQKYSHPCPLTSIPRASYPFSLNHGGGPNPNRKTHIGVRDNLGIIRLELMTSTTSRWHSTAELYPFPAPIEKWNWLILSQRVERLNATILEQLRAGSSFRTITDMKIMVKIGFNCQLPLSEIGLTSDSEGTGVTSLFHLHFHSRVLMCFHAPLRPRKMDKFLFLRTHTRFVTTIQKG